MKIRSIGNKALRRLIEGDDAKGIRPDLLNRVRNTLAALISADDIDSVEGPPGWRIHPATAPGHGAFQRPAIGA